jgi:hypothetical protein
MIYTPEVGEQFEALSKAYIELVRQAPQIMHDYTLEQTTPILLWDHAWDAAQGVEN